MTPEFYARFEELYRGDRADVQRIQRGYLSAATDVLQQYPDACAVDLGCGRGEWLELLQQHGWHVEGVDTSPAMLEECRRHGLSDLRQTDALSALQTLADASRHLISAFHLVEHLPFEDVFELLREARRVLVPGGLLLLETPNPENAVVGHYSFYLDPTHRAPLPPPLLLFAVQQAGFDQVVVLRANGPAEPARDASASDRLAWALDAYPDYAVLGKVEPADGSRPPSPGLEHLIHQASQRHASVSLVRTALQQQAAAVERQGEAIARLYQSRSWRYTEPLRVLAHRLQWARARLSTGLRSAARRSRQFLRATLRPSIVALARQPRLKARLQRMIYRYEADDASFDQPGEYGEWHPPLSNPARERAMELAESQQGMDAAPRALLIDGHFNGSYSLAGINRGLVYSLERDRPDMALAIRPRHVEPMDLADLPGGANEHARLHPLQDRTGFEAVPLSERMVLYHHFPPVSDPDRSEGMPVALFFWEESQVPPEVVAVLNQYDGVLVPAWSVARALVDSGCTAPVEQVRLPLQLPFADADPLPTIAPGSGAAADADTIHLLHVSSGFPRKGVDRLLQGFNTLAARQPHVHLTLKTFPNPHNRVDQWLGQRVTPACLGRITWINRDCTPDELRMLYQRAHIVVLPARGEGLNLPAIEAVCQGRPVVATGYGPHLDLLPSQAVYPLRFRFQRARSHLSTPQSVWVDPDPAHIAETLEHLLQRLRTEPDALRSELRQAQTVVRERFFEQGSARPLLAALGRLRDSQRARAPAYSAGAPLVLVTTWNSACGIAEYSRFLVRELLRCGQDVDIRAPRPGSGPRELTVDQDTDLPGPGCLHLQRTWDTEPPALDDLPPAAVLWLQYHPAFFALDARLAAGFEQHRARGGQVHITLHNTCWLQEVAPRIARAAAVALAHCDRVMVHTVGDLNRLKSLGVVHNSLLIPHGVARPEPSVLAVRPGSAPGFTIGCFGFLLPHKGVAELIRAFARLARPEARLCLVTAVRDEGGSRRTFEHCMHLAARLGVQRQIEWHTDFLPLATAQKLLRACNVVVLPYRTTGESSSAAARAALAACPEVAVTSRPIFEDLGDAVCRLPGDSPKAIADFLQSAAREADRAGRKPRHEARERWLQEHDWSRIAAEMRARFRGIARSRSKDFAAFARNRA